MKYFCLGLLVLFTAGCTVQNKYVPRAVRIACPTMKVVHKCPALPPIDWQTILTSEDNLLKKMIEEDYPDLRVEYEKCRLAVERWNTLYDNCPRVEVIDQSEAKWLGTTDDEMKPMGDE